MDRRHREEVEEFEGERYLDTGEKQDFEANAHEAKTPLLRLFLLATATLTVAFAAWDRLIDPTHWPTTFVWRILGSLFLVAVATKKQFPQTAARHDLLVVVLAIGYTLYLLLLFAQLNRGLILGIPSISIVLILSALLLVRSRRALALVLVLMTCFSAAAMLGLNNVILWSHLVFVSTSLGLGLLMAFTLEGKDRKEFELRHQLLRLASTDTLTGALNRRAAQQLLDQETERSRRYDRPLSMLMLDIDHFKRVNDTWGHQWGDRILQHIASLCRSELRLSDRLVRWGGEEFLVVLPETPLREAGQLAERLRMAIQNHPLTGPSDEKIQITASVGYTTVEANCTWEASLAAADQALYRAKAAGRNRCQATA